MQNGYAFLPNPNIVLKDALLHWLEDRKLAAKEIDYPQREAKMIEGKSVVVKLGEIIDSSSTVSECSVLEYKLYPHDMAYRCEFIKDILGLLNSYERPSEDRFLIYGIENKHRKALGYPFGDALDDANYQELFNKISPRPHIEFHEVDASRFIEVETGEKQFACFYIPSENFGHVYELNAPLEDRVPRNNKRSRLEMGASFVRVGSSTRPMVQADRDFINANRKQESFEIIKDLPNAFDPNGLSIFALAAILGAWDESNENDRALIELASDMSFDNWVAPIREQSLLDSGFCSFSRGVWRVRNRSELVAMFSANITPGILDKLKPLLIEALTAPDAKYDLQPKQRYMSSVFKRGPVFSEALRVGIAEYLAMWGTGIISLPKCSTRYVDNYIYGLIYPVICADDWRILASASSFITFLSEASPEKFLILVGRALDEGEALVRFLKEKSEGIFTHNYGAELFLGIRYAARPESTFSRAISLLIKLYPYSTFAEDTLVCILLPWLPQTDASIMARIPLGQKLAKNGCWNCLLKLLPNVTMSGFALVEPKYLKVNPLPDSFSRSEFWAVSRPYTLAAIEGSAGDVEKTLDLIGNMKSIHMAGCTQEFVETLLKTCIGIDEDDRFKIWLELKKYLSRCEKYAEADWVPNAENLKTVAEAEKKIISDDITFEARYYFAAKDYELIEGRDWEKSEKGLLKNRVNALEELCKDQGLSEIFDLSKYCCNCSVLGICCAQTSFADRIDNEMKKSLLEDDSSMLEVACGYYSERYRRQGESLLQRPINENWSTQSSLAFYSALPCNKEVWSAAEAKLKEESHLYWQKAACCRKVDTVEEAVYIFEQYCSVGRQSDALLFAHYCIEDDVDVDPDILLKCLQGYSPDSRRGFETHFVPEICDYIARKYPTIDLAWQEFRLFPLFQDGDESYLLKLLSSNPEFFVAILSLAYKPHNRVEDQTHEASKDAATRAFEVLWRWKRVPGLQDDGEVDKEAFDRWIAMTLEKSRKADRLEVAEITIGSCLFHAPKDQTGLFINRTIADFLDTNANALRGFATESVNSLGAMTVDGTGKTQFSLAEEYESKAKELEGIGLLDFAATVREISSGFVREGKDEIEREW